MTCTKGVAGMVCTLESGHDGRHHLVAGVCPTHGAPVKATSRLFRPVCSACGVYLVPPTPKVGAA
jgi:hypothetical protein